MQRMCPITASFCDTHRLPLVRPVSSTTRRTSARHASPNGPSDTMSVTLDRLTRTPNSPRAKKARIIVRRACLLKRLRDVSVKVCGRVRMKSFTTRIVWMRHRINVIGIILPILRERMRTCLVDAIIITMIPMAGGVVEQMRTTVNVRESLAKSRKSPRARPTSTRRTHRNRARMATTTLTLVAAITHSTQLTTMTFLNGDGITVHQRVVPRGPPVVVVVVVVAGVGVPRAIRAATLATAHMGDRRMVIHSRTASGMEMETATGMVRPRLAVGGARRRRIGITSSERAHARKLARVCSALTLDSTSSEFTILIRRQKDFTTNIPLLLLLLPLPHFESIILYKKVFVLCFRSQIGLVESMLTMKRSRITHQRGTSEKG